MEEYIDRIRVRRCSLQTRRTKSEHDSRRSPDPSIDLRSTSPKRRLFLPCGNRNGCTRLSSSLHDTSWSDIRKKMLINILRKLNHIDFLSRTAESSRNNRPHENRYGDLSVYLLVSLFPVISSRNSARWSRRQTVNGINSFKLKFTRDRDIARDRQ